MYNQWIFMCTSKKCNWYIISVTNYDLLKVQPNQELLYIILYIMSCIRFPGLQCSSKSSLTAYLKTTWTLSQFWRQEVWNSGIGNAMFLWRILKIILPCFSQASGVCQQSLESLDCSFIIPLSASIFTWLYFLSMFLSLLGLSYKGSINCI